MLSWILGRDDGTGFFLPPTKIMIKEFFMPSFVYYTEATCLEARQTSQDAGNLTK